MIFDTHAHYDDEAFDPDRDELLGSMPARGVGHIVNVGASPDGARTSVALAKKYAFLYSAVGIHPDDCGALDDVLLDEIRAMAQDPSSKCVAIGEIGLDYHWMVETKEKQKEAFIRQLRLSQELDLPVNVHSRDAAQDTFDTIKAEHAGTTGGIIHCFSGSAEMAREYVKLGYYIGVGGVVTFKNARVLKQVVLETPMDRIVTETDCPYLAPVPYRGKRNDSSMIAHVIEAIAQIKGMEKAQAEEILFENAMRVYRLCAAPAVT